MAASLLPLTASLAQYFFYLTHFFLKFAGQLFSLALSFKLFLVQCFARHFFHRAFDLVGLSDHFVLYAFFQFVLLVESTELQRCCLEQVDYQTFYVSELSLLTIIYKFESK